MFPLRTFLHYKTATAENNKGLTVEKCSLFSDRGNESKLFVIEILRMNQRIISSVEAIPVVMKRYAKTQYCRKEKDGVLTRAILILRFVEAQASAKYSLILQYSGANLTFDHGGFIKILTC